MDLNKVKHLYQEKGLSAQDVADELDKTVWQVYRFMKKHRISRRKASQTLKIKFNRSPLSFKRKVNLTTKEQQLHLAGLMLYWAEGAKTGGDKIDFANSDQHMAVIFLKMLRQIYQPDEKRLRALLYCYSNQDPKKLIGFWSNLLNIPTDQFLKPYVRKVFNRSKKHKMPHGLVHIRYNDKRLFQQIMTDIKTASKDFTS